MAFRSKLSGLVRDTFGGNSVSFVNAPNMHMFNAMRCMTTELFVGARAITDREETGRSRGFGFVHYTTDESAYKAVSDMDGKELDGRHPRFSLLKQPVSSTLNQHLIDYPTSSFRRSFARSNSSFFSCNGKAFLSSVLRLRWRKKMFLVDAGFGTPTICLQNELTGASINRAIRFENKVGSLLAGEPLLLPRKLRQNRAWMELKKIWRTNKKVKGFLLNKVRGGYSVGIAGFITFLPLRYFQKRRKRENARDRFTIARLQQENIVVL